jgi:hypothetical protein
MCDFAEKYNPSMPKEIIGNVRQIYQIEQWLTNYDTNRIKFFNGKKKGKKPRKIIVPDISDDTEQKDDEVMEKTEIDIEDIPKKKSTKKNQNNEEHGCLLITGEHGVGKTCTVMAVLNNLKYSVQSVNLSKLGSNKNVPDYIKKLTTGTNIFDKINGKKNIKTAVVIDEIETAAGSQVEKNFILSLLKENEENWFLPVIFVSCGKHNKQNTLLKTNSTNVKFNQPGRDDLMLFLSKIATKEKMHFDDISIGHEITDHAQNDYRRLASILQDVKRMYESQSITDENIRKYFELLQDKNLKVEIYNASAQMITSYKNVEDCLRIYNKEKVLMPLMIHQNYIKVLVNNSFKGNKKFDLVCELAESIAFGDLVENYIYSDQNWDMQDIHGILTCAIPSHKLSSEKMKVQLHHVKSMLEFPYDLNRTSIRQINKRNITNSNACLKNLEISDFIYANRLIRRLLEDERIDECAKLFEDYGAKVENIESILKIDKINETKTTLQSATKKKLTQLLGSKNPKTSKKSK